jgi:hypothetical protein
MYTYMTMAMLEGHAHANDLQVTYYPSESGVLWRRLVDDWSTYPHMVCKLHNPRSAVRSVRNGNTVAWTLRWKPRRYTRELDSLTRLASRATLDPTLLILSIVYMYDVIIL